MKPPRSSGLLDRKVQQRDARLFVIAVEGEQTGEEFLYFSRLESDRLVDGRRVKLLLLPADPVRHDSAPKQVLERLDEHCGRHGLRPGLDEHWLVLDVDRWPSQALAEVGQAAAQRRYGLAVSNPCFELWLLLHSTSELGFLAGVERPRQPRATKQELARVRALAEWTVTAISLRAASERARALDVEPGDRWPNRAGSRVYRLIDALAEAGALMPS